MVYDYPHAMSREKPDNDLVISLRRQVVISNGAR